MRLKISRRRKRPVRTTSKMVQMSKDNQLTALACITGKPGEALALARRSIAETCSGAFFIRVGILSVERPRVSVGARSQGAVRALPILIACANVIVFALSVTRALIWASAKGNACKQQGNKVAEHP